MSETKRGFQGPKPRSRRPRARKTDASPQEEERSGTARPQSDFEADSEQDDTQMLIPGEQPSPVEAPKSAQGEKRERSHSEGGGGRDSENERAFAPAPAGNQPRPRDEKPRNRPGDDYSISVHFDRGQKSFVATVLEIPELRAVGGQREQAIRELDRKLEQFIQNAKRKNEAIPEPIQLKRYPDRLEVGISQTLFRKLDLLSRQEKVSLDQLVSELLTGSVERRKETSHKGNDNRRPQPHHQQQSQSGNQRHGHQQRRGQSRNYHDTMDNRENFMEYVRNLEKGGGSGWRKK